VKLSENGVALPYILLLVTGISTISIWLFSMRIDSCHEEQVQVLKKRIEVLESVACLDELEGKFKALDR